MNSLKHLFEFLTIESNELEEGKFNPETLDQFKTAQEMIRVAVGKLPLLGAGSSRAVFLLDSKRALKIAKNEAGLAQNLAEYELSEDPGVAPLVTKIYKFSESGWMISELVRPLRSEKEFQELTKVPWKFMEVFFMFYERHDKDIGLSFEKTVENFIQRDKLSRNPSPGMSVRGIEHVPFI